MQRINTQTEYKLLVQEVANREREMAEDVTVYEGYEHEFTIAQMVITAPTRVGDEVTMQFNGEPYVDTCVAPTDVLLQSPNATDVDDQLIADNEIRRAAVQALAYDLREELTPDDVSHEDDAVSEEVARFDKLVRNTVDRPDGPTDAEREELFALWTDIRDRLDNHA
jgi:hypothetical protein